MPNFTSLANAKQWAGATTSTDDLLLERLISDASQMILAHLQRQGMWNTVYNDVYDGYGTSRFLLDQWPVLSVSALVTDGNNIPAMPSPQTAAGYGYILQPWNGSTPGRPQELTFRGGKFCYGQSNVAVTYNAGYSVISESHLVPSDSIYQVTVNQTQGNWGQDDGVVYANGTPLVAVTGTPSIGQYNPPTNIDGIYQFSAADAGASVFISYSFTPYDIEQACLEIVAERYKYQSRIGQKTATQSGATTASYDMSAMTDAVKTRLMPYRRKVLL